MAQQFRTTVSAVFWSETTDQSDATVEDIKDAIPSEDVGSTLVTVEYVAAGRPPSLGAPPP
jgi:hypothetical protein